MTNENTDDYLDQKIMSSVDIVNKMMDSLRAKFEALLYDYDMARKGLFEVYVKYNNKPGHKAILDEKELKALTMASLVAGYTRLAKDLKDDIKFVDKDEVENYDKSTKEALK